MLVHDRGDDDCDCDCDYEDVDVGDGYVVNNDSDDFGNCDNKSFFGDVISCLCIRNS